MPGRWLLPLGAGSQPRLNPPVPLTAQRPPYRRICAQATRQSMQSAQANIRRYTGDRRSLNPSGRITQDTRVIIANFFDPIYGDDHPCITRSARVSGYRAGRYLLSVTATVQLERCHPADPGRRAREAVAAAHKLTVSANFKVGDAARGGFAVRAVLHDSPGPALRASGTPKLSGSQGAKESGGWERSGNHQRSPWL